MLEFLEFLFKRSVKCPKNRIVQQYLIFYDESSREEDYSVILED